MRLIGAEDMMNGNVGLARRNEHESCLQSVVNVFKGMEDLTDYTIAWAYIVSRMESRYGFAPDNEEHLSFGEIERYLSDIWTEFFEVRYAEERQKNEGRKRENR